MFAAWRKPFAQQAPRDTRKYQKSCAARAALKVTTVSTTAMETPSESVAISAGSVSCGAWLPSLGTAKPNLVGGLNIVGLEACRLPPCRSHVPYHVELRRTCRQITANP